MQVLAAGLMTLLQTAAFAHVDSYPEGCLDVSSARNIVGLTGQLSLRVFPGPPNFESVANGDERRSVFILELQEPICIDDGGDFADPDALFSSVHVYSADPTVSRELRKSLARTVRVIGNGFAGFNGYHHAPLVVDVEELRAIEND